MSERAPPPSHDSVEEKMRTLTVERIDNGWLLQMRSDSNKLIGHYAFTTGREMLALLVTLLSIDGRPDRIECKRCKVHDQSGAFVRYCQTPHCPLKGIPE
jgi:hypothetical protein